MDLKANDVDLDDDPVAVTAVRPGTGGTLTLNQDGTWSYTPNPDFNGADSLTYTISDGRAASAPAR